MDFHSSTFFIRGLDCNSVISLLHASGSSFTHQHLNKTSLIRLFLCVFSDKYYMYSKFTSYRFSLLYLDFLLSEVNSNKYHCCAIFVKSLSAYAISIARKRT